MAQGIRSKRWLTHQPKIVSAAEVNGAPCRVATGDEIHFRDVLRFERAAQEALAVGKWGEVAGLLMELAERSRKDVRRIIGELSIPTNERGEAVAVPAVAPGVAARRFGALLLTGRWWQVSLAWRDELHRERPYRDEDVATLASDELSRMGGRDER